MRKEKRKKNSKRMSKIKETQCEREFGLIKKLEFRRLFLLTDTASKVKINRTKEQRTV